MTEQVSEQPDDPAARAAKRWIPLAPNVVHDRWRDELASVIREEYASLVAEAERLKRIAGGTHILARDLNIAKRELDTLRGANARLEGEVARLKDERDIENLAEKIQRSMCGYEGEAGRIREREILSLLRKHFGQDGELQSRASQEGNPSSSALAVEDEPERRHRAVDAREISTDGPQREPVTADTEGQPRADEASRPTSMLRGINETADRKLRREREDARTFQPPNQEQGERRCFKRACNRIIGYSYTRQSCCDPCACVSVDAIGHSAHTRLCADANPSAPPAAQPSEPEPITPCGDVWGRAIFGDAYACTKPVGHAGQHSNDTKVAEPPECPCCPDGCRNPHACYSRGGMTCATHLFCLRECRDRALKKIEEARVNAFADGQADGFKMAEAKFRVDVARAAERSAKRIASRTYEWIRPHAHRIILTEFEWPRTEPKSDAATSPLLPPGNWHAIEGANGRCACGPDAGCGERLQRYVSIACDDQLDRQRWEVLDEMPDAWRRHPGSLAQKVGAMVSFFAATPRFVVTPEMREKVAISMYAISRGDTPFLVSETYWGRYSADALWKRRFYAATDAILTILGATVRAENGR